MIHVLVSVQMEAPATRVYDVIRDAYRMDTWHPGIPRCVREGSVRILTLADGVVLRERMDLVDDVARIHRYTIVDTPGPLLDYHAQLCVRELSPQRCVAEWSATWHAPDGQAGATMDAVRGTFTSGLEAVRMRVTGG